MSSATCQMCIKICEKKSFKVTCIWTHAYVPCVADLSNSKLTDWDLPANYLILSYSSLFLIKWYNISKGKTW